MQHLKKYSKFWYSPRWILILCGYRKAVCHCSSYIRGLKKKTTNQPSLSLHKTHKINVIDFLVIKYFLPRNIEVYILIQPLHNGCILIPCHSFSWVWLINVFYSRMISLLYLKDVSTAEVILGKPLSKAPAAVPWTG